VYAIYLFYSGIIQGKFGHISVSATLGISINDNKISVEDGIVYDILNPSSPHQIGARAGVVHNIQV